MLKNITLHIEPDYDSLSRKAAIIFAQALKDNPIASYGFAAGSTPLGMYEELRRMHSLGEIDLSQITAFSLDEYHPIRQSDPKSYNSFMAKNLFDEVSLLKDRRNIPSGEAGSPIDEAAAYDERIHMAGGIELQILGMGHNGHIGFNEPADIFSKQTAYVPLTENTIKSNSRFFASEEEVPRHAITMGIHSIMMARQILLLVSGEAKAGILRDALLGPITPLVPASILQLHQDVIVIADRDAAKNIQ